MTRELPIPQRGAVSEGTVSQAAAGGSLALIFEAGGQRYAVPCRRIMEVLPLVPLRPLSGAPSCVAGVIDFRGAVTPVIDLSQVIADEPTVARLSSRIILVRVSMTMMSARVTGLLAERVTEAVHVPTEDLSPPGVDMADKPFLGKIFRDPTHHSLGNDGESSLVQLVLLDQLLPRALRYDLFPGEGEGADP